MINRNTEKYYLEEGCPYFVLALHRIFGYEIKILLSNKDNTIAHVFAYDKMTDKAIDIRGKLSEEDIKRGYYDLIEPTVLSIDESELKDLMGNNKPLYPYNLEEIMKAMDIIYKEKNLYD